jgi:hypothetical protein
MEEILKSLFEQIEGCRIQMQGCPCVVDRFQPGEDAGVEIDRILMCLQLRVDIVLDGIECPDASMATTVFPKLGGAVSLAMRPICASCSRMAASIAGA